MEERVIDKTAPSESDAAESSAAALRAISDPIRAVRTCWRSVSTFGLGQTMGLAAAGLSSSDEQTVLAQLAPSLFAGANAAQNSSGSAHPIEQSAQLIEKLIAGSSADELELTARALGQLALIEQTLRR